MSQQINLYDAALERQREWLTLGNVVAVCLLLLGVVGGSGHFARTEAKTLAARAAASESQLKTAREQIAALTQKIASRKPDARLEHEVAAQRLLLTARREVLATLRDGVGADGGATFADYLRGFARQTVSGLWLTAFNFDAKSGGIEIRGRTTDPALLPEYIRRLNQESAFQGRAFASLKLDAGQAETAAGAAPVLPRYHEFVLIPVMGDGRDAAKLTRNAGVAGSAG
ncbi:MAG: PilN domain-containing protein [Pseudomonadota bacterium]